MEKGSIVGSIDLAQVVLYTFFVFFFSLIFYLRREDKREGYPLVTDRMGTVQGVGFPSMPAPKLFRLPHGGVAMAPSGRAEPAVTQAVPIGPWPGAPLEPTGNPMLDAVGPASYALRADEPDLTFDGRDKLVPLRADAAYFLAARDPDPRGMPVVGADGAVAGTVCDVWVDRSEVIMRYLEVQLPGGRQVLLPVNISRINKRRGFVKVGAILASQFADVPALKSPDRVTLLEEDRICGYYGGGYLYAVAARTEPLL